MPVKPEAKTCPETWFLVRRSVIGWALAVPFAFAGAVSAHYSGSGDLVKALAAMGFFGLAGGVSHALLIHAAGARIGPLQTLLLAVIWSATCIGSVSPLFFTSGTNAKMALLSFYSFSFCGALGALAACAVTRPLFGDRFSDDMTGTVLCWSFGFGAAAVAGDIAAAGLQTILPDMLAWLGGFTVMGLIVGCGAGCGLVYSFQLTNPVTARKTSGLKTPLDRFPNNRFYVAGLVLVCLPFYLNDFSNIHMNSWHGWLLIDYLGVKLFPLFVFLWLFKTRKLHPADLGLNRQALVPFAATFFVAALPALFIDQNGYLLRAILPGYSRLGAMPAIGNPLWLWIDLTFGLVMVGIVEELVFRGYLLFFISRYTRKGYLIVTFSALAFGLIHWSGGFNQVVVTALIGALFMRIYLKTRSLPAVMLAHFAVNFIAYSNTLPKTLFRFY